MTSDERRWQEKADAWRQDALARTRVVAEGWLKALAAFAGLTVLVTLLGGTSSIDDLESPWGITVGVLALASLLGAAMAIWLGHRAAFGEPRPTWTGFADFQARDVADLAAVLSDLRSSRRWGAASGAALLVAVAVVSYAPAEHGVLVVVPVSGKTLCVPGDAAARLTFSAGTVRAVRQSDHCPREQPR